MSTREASSIEVNARALFRSQHAMLGSLKKDFDSATYLISETANMCNRLLIPLIKYYPEKNIVLNDAFDIIIPGGDVFASDDTLHEYAVSIVYAIIPRKYKIIITLDDAYVHIETPLFKKCVCENLYWHDNINEMISAINAIFAGLPKTLSPSFVTRMLEEHKKQQDVEQAGKK